MILLHPIYLILIVPLLAAFAFWGMRSRLLLGLRVVALVLVVAALAGVALYLPSGAGTVIVIADRSLSLPPEAENQEKDIIDRIQHAMSADDNLGVVSFGRSATVERLPASGKFPGFAAEVGRDASNLAEAIDVSLGLIPKGSPGRILVLSDGQWTGRDPVDSAVRAAERGIGIDHRPLDRLVSQDVAVARIDAPSRVNPGESFLITAWVYASQAQEVEYELRRGDVQLSAGRRQLEAGLNRFTFRDQAEDAGAMAYALIVAAKGDTVPENNTARLIVGVDGAKPLLVVSPTAESGFPGFIAAGGVPVVARQPKECVWTLEELANYSGVVLENVPADTIGHVGMETLAAWVQQTGSGLMLTGGRASYGQGGYFKSPIDPILPVSMELRQEHRKLALAIVVTLDRSGSMAMPVGGGRVKMDLANLGTASVIDLLGPSDEFGCIAVDSAPHIIQPLGVLKAKGPVRDKVLKINSEGGGIFIYEALEASLAMLSKAKAGAKHIILFSDAADSEEPKTYKDLLKKCKALGITVSVIGLGKETDTDGALLKDIAALGGGRIFFTDIPEELPRLFAQDTFVVARNAFLSDPTPIKSVAGLNAIANKNYDPPDLGGYNLCYLRDKAMLGAVTLDEYKAPVVAAWQSGAGRVLCYTGEADGKFTGKIAGWKDAGEFFSSLARWTMGRADKLPKGVIITQERSKGLATVKVHLDPDRKEDPFAVPPEVAVLRSTGGKKPAIEKSRVTWTGPDTLAVNVPLYGTETVLATVDLPGHGAVPLSPTCLPYSPEFEPPSLRAGATADDSLTRWGPVALDSISRMTGGKERLELPSIWRDMPRHPRLIPLSMWLIVAAIGVFLLEVLERLTGIFGRGLRLARPRLATSSEVAAEPSPVSATVPVVLVAKKEGAPPPPPAAKEESAGGLLDALRQVQNRKQH